MKVFYGQRTFLEFPEKNQERQRSTLVFVQIAILNFELELTEDFMEVTETLTVIVNNGEKVSALYLLIFLRLSVVG